MDIKRIYEKVKKDVSTNPRKYDCCSNVEIMNDLMLLYDNRMTLCDDCLDNVFNDYGL